LGIGDWGLGIGDWGLGPIPNPHEKKKFFIYSKRKVNLHFIKTIKLKEEKKD